MKYLAFLIYIVIWDMGILIGTFYAVFIEGASGWWFLLAIFLMLSCFRPSSFGIKEFKKL